MDRGGWAGFLGPPHHSPANGGPGVTGPRSPEAPAGGGGPLAHSGSRRPPASSLLCASRLPPSVSWPSPPRVCGSPSACTQLSACHVPLPRRKQPSWRGTRPGLTLTASSAQTPSTRRLAAPGPGVRAAAWLWGATIQPVTVGVSSLVGARSQGTQRSREALAIHASPLSPPLSSIPARWAAETLESGVKTPQAPCSIRPPRRSASPTPEGPAPRPDTSFLPLWLPWAQERVPGVGCTRPGPASVPCRRPWPHVPWAPH